MFAQYVSNFSYTASGGISQMRLGNGRWETAKFNNRMQVTELGLGASASDAGLWKTAYEYGELNTNGTVDTAKNTGNIAKQTLSFNGLTHPLVQSYKYDALYRITEATETSNSVANWFQVWGYDRYGNRTSFTQNIGGNPASVNPSIDMNTNRFNAGQGFTFDKNGNIITDVSTDNFTRTFVFNGDNKQTEVKKDGVTVGRYFYDGEGKRVKKVSDLETTIFVYSSGKLVAEYSTATPPASPSVNYTTTDHLGTPRIITDQFGQVQSRRDFLPFGEELTINVGSRSTALKYGTSTDDVRQKFTGYQKDEETGLDFAEARMYENRYGRFTAVDPLLASGKSANPQSFNRFIYVGNRPLLLTDPFGLDPWWKGKCKESGYCTYIESKNRPEDEDGNANWKQLDFGNSYYTTVADWGDTGQTAYLYASGGQDFGGRVAQVMSLGAFFNPFSQIDPKQIGIRHPEMSESNGQYFMGMFGSLYNNGAFIINNSTPNQFTNGQFSIPYYSPTTGGEKIGFWTTNVATLFGGGTAGVRASFATKADEAIFYSGSGARSYANQIAVQTGGKTIEKTFGGAIINRITNTPVLGRPLYQRGKIGEAISNSLWRPASALFARGASGNVRYIQGQPFNTSGIWNTIERPILMRNPNVTIQRFELPSFR